MVSTYYSVKLEHLTCTAIIPVRLIKVNIQLDNLQWSSYTILDSVPLMDMNNLGIIQHSASLGNTVELEVEVEGDAVYRVQANLGSKSGILNYPIGGVTYSLTYTCFP